MWGAGTQGGGEAGRGQGVKGELRRPPIILSLPPRPTPPKYYYGLWFVVPPPPPPRFAEIQPTHSTV